MKIKRLRMISSWALLLLASCTTVNKQQAELDAKDFTRKIDGKATALYSLKNAKGTVAKITNYGGRLVSLLIPDRTGKLVDVVVGMKSVTAYEQATEPYFGATIGRYGNRIA